MQQTQGFSILRFRNTRQGCSLMQRIFYANNDRSHVDAGAPATATATASASASASASAGCSGRRQYRYTFLSFSFYANSYMLQTLLMNIVESLQKLK